MQRTIVVWSAILLLLTGCVPEKKNGAISELSSASLSPSNSSLNSSLQHSSSSSINMGEEEESINHPELQSESEFSDLKSNISSSNSPSSSLPIEEERGMEQQESTATSSSVSSEPEHVDPDNITRIELHQIFFMDDRSCELTNSRDFETVLALLRDLTLSEVYGPVTGAGIINVTICYQNGGPEKYGFHREIVKDFQKPDVFKWYQCGNQDAFAILEAYFE